MDTTTEETKTKETGDTLKLIETRTRSRAFRLTLEEDAALELYAEQHGTTPTVVLKSALKQTGVI